MNNQKLLETVADISFIAGERKYFSGDSRADVSNFVFWANQFEKENFNTNWDEVDYRILIEKFTENKLSDSLR